MLLLFNSGLSFAKLEAKVFLNLVLDLNLDFDLSEPLVHCRVLFCLFFVQPPGQMVYSKQNCTCGAP